MGAEFEIAVQQLFSKWASNPAALSVVIVFISRPKIDIFVGDIFVLTHLMIGKIDAIYDRAALVALPESMRKLYSSHLIDLALAHHSY